MASAIKQLAAPLNVLPPVDFAFAYGSGVFRQSGLPNNQVPMVDYILGVSSPAQWHSQNIEKNPTHYSSYLAYFGGKMIARVADTVGVGVHFNPFVPWQDKTIKYGVVGMDNVVQDIFTWNSLYISGRLQKPVNVLVDNAGLAIANKVNLQAAVSTALLLLPEKFSEEDLYVMIASLSYMGDVRLFFAEDRNKVRNIVHGSGKNFHELYRTPLCHAAASGMLYLPNTFGDECPALLSQDCSNHAVRELVTSLPSHLLKGLSKQMGLQYGSSGCMVADAFVKFQTNRPRILKRAIGRIVRLSSFRQMASGFFAAGGLNAFYYVSRKISKAWNSRLRG